VAEANRIHVRLDAREENVAVVRAAVASAAATVAFTVPELEELRIAVSEAVSNAVLHAYPGGGGEVEVTISVGADGIVVVVEDKGRGIADLDAARQPEFTTLEGHLGLGFAFLEAMADGVEVTSAPGAGTRVLLRKRPHADPPAGGEADGDRT